MALTPSSISVPIKNVEGKDWLILNALSNKGVLRTAKIDKRKNPVPDWDGHHCDEASVEGSVRYYPRKWQINT